MSNAKTLTLEVPATARLVFRGMGSLLIINPRKRDHDFVYVPNASACGKCGGTDRYGAPHADETGMSYEPSEVPLTRFLDESGDYADQWFAFWEEDCAFPTLSLYVVRAESFEQAYEDFLTKACREVKPEDLDEDQRAMFEGDGNLPDGYTFDSDGVLKHTENVNGREIELIEITIEGGKS